MFAPVLGFLVLGHIARGLWKGATASAPREDEDHDSPSSSDGPSYGYGRPSTERQTTLDEFGFSK